MKNSKNVIQNHAQKGMLLGIACLVLIMVFIGFMGTTSVALAWEAPGGYGNPAYSNTESSAYNMSSLTTYTSSGHSYGATKADTLNATTFDVKNGDKTQTAIFVRTIKLSDNLYHAMLAGKLKLEAVTSAIAENKHITSNTDHKIKAFISIGNSTGNGRDQFTEVANALGNESTAMGIKNTTKSLSSTATYTGTPTSGQFIRFGISAEQTPGGAAMGAKAYMNSISMKLTLSANGDSTAPTISGTDNAFTASNQVTISDYGSNLWKYTVTGANSQSQTLIAKVSTSTITLANQGVSTITAYDNLGNSSTKTIKYYNPTVSVKVYTDGQLSSDGGAIKIDGSTTLSKDGKTVGGSYAFSAEPNAEYYLASWRKTSGTGQGYTYGQNQMSYQIAEGDAYTSTLTFYANFKSITTTDKTVVYDGLSHGVSYLPESGFEVSYHYTSRGETQIYDSADAPAEVGEYDALITLKYDNEVVLTKTVVLTINKRHLEITPNPASKSFGDIDPDLSYTITSGSFLDGDSFGGSLGREIGEEVGYYLITIGTLALLDETHYSFSFDENVYFEIEKRSITLSASGEKFYGEDDGPFEYIVSSGSLLVGHELVVVLERQAGENAGSYLFNFTNVYIFEDELSALANYDITFAECYFEVKKKVVNIVAEDTSKIYGDSDPEFTYQIAEDALLGDDEITGTLEREVGENVGEYKLLQGSLDINYNYEIVFVEGTFTITRLAITITADDASKVYGDADPEFTYQITEGSLSGDDEITGTLSKADGVNVGEYAILQGSLIINDNYEIIFIEGTITITKRAITVTAEDATKIYGDSDPTFTFQIAEDALVYGDEISGALSRVDGENKGTYFITLGTLGFVNNQDENISDNYEIIFVEADFSITARNITITADSNSKEYGDIDPVATLKLIEGTLAFSDTLQGTFSREAGEDIGVYLLSSAGIDVFDLDEQSVLDNYEITFIECSFEIVKRAVTITADDASKVYGDSDTAFTYQITDGSLVGDDEITGTLLREEGINAGEYAILQGSLTINDNYEITFVGGTFTITARAITITADGATKIYGDADTAFTYQITDGSLVGDDEITGTLSRAEGANVGEYAILQGSLDINDNYEVTFVEGTFTINVRAITITADDESKVYGDADPTFTFQIAEDALVFGDEITGTLSREEGINVGEYAILLGSLIINDNYEITFVEGTFTITARAITITADGASKVYGDADPTFTFQIAEDALAYDDEITGALSRVDGENKGTYAITLGTLTIVDELEINVSSNYEFTLEEAFFTITAREITVNADDASKVYGDADPEFTYQITDGSLVGDDEITGTLSREDGINVGEYKVLQGSLDINDNYEITFVEGTFTINTRAITITADDASKIYGDSDTAFTYQITTGSLVGDDEITGTLSREEGINVGEYKVLQGSLAINDNYEVTFVEGTFTITARAITITADDAGKVYGDADPEFTYQITDGSLVGDDEITGTLSRAEGANVGEYAILQGSLKINDNYEIIFVEGTFAITARAITITADDANKVYGDADPTFTYQITTGSLVGDDEITGTLSRAEGANVGEYVILQGSLIINDNYEVTFVEGTFTITARAITITADDASKVYGDPDTAFTYQITDGSLVFGDEITGTLSREDGINVGEYKVLQGSLKINDNYEVTFVEGTFTINARAITITADDASKVYGDFDPTFTFQIAEDALVFGDEITGALSRVDGENKGTYAITLGTLTIVDELEINVSSNYEFTLEEAFFTITAREITVTADDATKIYGDSDPTFTYQITTGSLVGDDEITGTLSREEGINVGEYKVLQGSLAINDNYEIIFVEGAFTITARAITITADDASKVYGDADPTFTYQIAEDALAYDDEITGTLVREEGMNVGEYAILQGSLTINDNYEVTFVEATFTITARAITITADDAGKVYGDADPEFTYQITDGSLVGDDEITGTLSRAEGANVGEYAILQGSLKINDNYEIIFVEGTFAITARAITITADDANKVYGDADTAFTYQITTGSLVGDDEITGTLSRAEGANVGEYAILQGSLIINDNYEVTFVEGTFTINARAITIQANGEFNKTYGNSEPTIGYIIASGELAYNDAFLGTLSRMVGENKGTYAITLGTLTIVDELEINVSSNYEFTLEEAFFTITAREITVTADDASKIYGDSDPEFTYQIAGDALAYDDEITGTLSREEGINVGEYAILLGSLDINDNYEVTFVEGTFTINARAITITADDASKVYGDADPVFTCKITSGTLAYDEKITGVPSRAEGANVGEYKVLQGSLLINDNYEITFVEGTLTITERNFEVGVDIKFVDKKVVFSGSEFSITAEAFIDGVSIDYTNNKATKAGVYEASATFSLANYASKTLSAKLTILQKVVTTEETVPQAIVTIEGGMDPSATITVNTNHDENSAGQANNALDKNFKEEVKKIINISLQLSGEQVANAGTAVIKLLIPSEIDNIDNLKIVHLSGNQTEQIVYVVEGDYLVFESDEFGDFAFIVSEPLPTNDSNNLALYIGLAGAAAAIVVAGAIATILIKKKRKA